VRIQGENRKDGGVPGSVSNQQTVLDRLNNRLDHTIAEQSQVTQYSKLTRPNTRKSASSRWATRLAATPLYGPALFLPTSSDKGEMMVDRGREDMSTRKGRVLSASVRPALSQDNLDRNDAQHQTNLAVDDKRVMRAQSGRMSRSAVVVSQVSVLLYRTMVVGSGIAAQEPTH